MSESVDKYLLPSMTGNFILALACPFLAVAVARVIVTLLIAEGKITAGAVAGGKALPQPPVFRFKGVTLTATSTEVAAECKVEIEVVGVESLRWWPLFDDATFLAGFLSWYMNGCEFTDAMKINTNLFWIYYNETFSVGLCTSLCVESGVNKLKQAVKSEKALYAILNDKIVAIVTSERIPSMSATSNVLRMRWGLQAGSQSAHGGEPERAGCAEPCHCRGVQGAHQARGWRSADALLASRPRPRSCGGGL